MTTFKYKVFIKFKVLFWEMDSIKLLITIYFLAFFYTADANSPNAENDSVENFVIVGVDYSSNTSSFGRFSSLAKQPSFSTFGAFYSKWGFNFGFSSYAIANSDSTATKFSYEYDINLGYDIKLSKSITLSATYAHFFYSKNSYLLKSLYNDEFSLGLYLQKGKFFGNISGYYLLGENNEWMNSATIGFNLESVGFSKNHLLTFSPEITVFMINQQYNQEYANKTYWYLSRYAEKFPNVRINDIYENPDDYQQLWKYLNKNQVVYKDFMSLDRDLALSQIFETDSKYNFSSVNLDLPIYYTFGNATLSFSYSISIPLNTPLYMDSKPVSYLSAGLFYSFSL